MRDGFCTRCDAMEPALHVACFCVCDVCVDRFCRKKKINKELLRDRASYVKYSHERGNALTFSIYGSGFSRVREFVFLGCDTMAAEIVV
jgi:hypothetical protein